MCCIVTLKIWARSPLSHANVTMVNVGPLLTSQRNHLAISGKSCNVTK